MNTFARVFAAVLVLGVVVLVVLVTLGGVAKKAIHDGVISRLKYKLPDGYKTNPSYEVCYHSNKAAFFEEYYMWNLTNVQETIDGGKPIFNLTGPYSYTQWYCNYDHTVHKEEGLLTYKTYYDGYMFLKDDSVTGDDVLITNVNPAYIALLRQLGSDYNLPYVMTGGALEGLIKQFQAPQTLALLWFNAVPKVLGSMNKLISIGIMSNPIAQTLGGIGLSNTFDPSYTSVTGLKAFVEFTLSYNASSDVSYATEAQQQIFTSWTNQNTLAQFIQTPVPTIMATYQVSANQAADLLTYLNYLFTFPAFATPATQALYAQWANATISPASLYTGWEVGMPFPTSTGISVADVSTLFDANNQCALTNSTGITVWLAVSQQKATLDALCPGVFTLTAQQQLQILQWLGSYSTTVVSKLLLPEFGISNWDDFAYAQWGHLVAGQSLQKAAGLPFAPEIAAFEDKVSNLPTALCATYTTEDAKALLNGSMPLFNLTYMTMFFGLMNAKPAPSFDVIGSIWPQLSMIKAICLVDYLLAIIQPNIVNPRIEAARAQGGGLFTTRTVREWLFTAQDPLLQTLGQPAAVGMVGNTTRSKADSDKLNATKIRIYTGDNDLYWSLMPAREGEVLPFWRVPVNITGYNGTQFLPNGYIDNLDDHEDEPLVLFHPRINRTIPFKNKGKDTWQGVNVRYLTLADDALASNNPANWPYYNDYSGVINKTSNPPGIPLFLSTPNFLSAEPAFYQNITFTDKVFADYNPNEKFSQHRLSLFILVEPTLGSSVWGNLPIQLNFKYGSTYYYPKVNPAFAPIYWNAIGAIASKKDLDSIKTDLYANQRAWKALIGVGAGVGALLIVAGIVGVHHFKKHENELKDLRESK